MITKRFISFLIVGILGSSVAFAQEEGKQKRKKKRAPGAGVAEGVGARTNTYKYGMAGCGLGSLVFEPSGMQVLAATTNGSFYSQTFGISFGTSNCNDPSSAKTAYEQEVFMNANLASLSKEAAQGDGVTLRAFAELLGCSDRYSDFSRLGQDSYDQIFSEPDQAEAVLAQYKAAIGADQALSGSCVRARTI
jgi:hypothetical protein